MRRVFITGASSGLGQALARAYAARDHVALVAFRGTDAELVLPPTRSLVQTKSRLAGVPGGGGTPLAARIRSVSAMLADRSPARTRRNASL